MQNKGPCQNGLELWLDGNGVGTCSQVTLPSPALLWLFVVIVHRSRLGEGPTAISYPKEHREREDWTNKQANRKEQKEQKSKSTAKPPGLYVT